MGSLTSVPVPANGQHPAPDEAPIGTPPLTEGEVAEAWRAALDERKREQARTAEAQRRDLRGEEVLPWQPFPIGLLPREAREYVRAHGAAIGCDEALVALPVLAVLSAAVGNSFRVQLKRSWEEPSTVWAVPVAPSGSAKSPAARAALRPVLDLEREAKERHELEQAEYDVALQAFDGLAKGEKKHQAPPAAPTRARFRLSDPTVEAALSVHQDNPRGLLLYRDELAGWLGSFDRYARGEADLQSWIEMHGGDPVQVDRKSGAASLYVERPAVAVTGTIQPDVLRGRLGEAHFSSGFAARLLLAEPPARARRWSDADVGVEEGAGYARLVRRLYALPAFAGAVPLSPAARELWGRWVDENGEKLDRLDPADRLRPVLAKMEASAARFALVFHLAGEVTRAGGRHVEPEPLAVDPVLRGIRLACWFRYEAARLYERYGFRRTSEGRDERRLRQLPGTFTADDVRAVWRVGQSRAYEVLKALQDDGRAERVEAGRYRRVIDADAFLAADLLDFGDFNPEPNA